MKDRDATVRVTEDNLIYAVDLVMVVTGKDANQSAEVLRRLSNEIFAQSKLQSRKLSTHNGSNTKLLTFKHAIELIMVLPGKMAKEIRGQFADIIHRHMAEADGDSPVHELARNTLTTGEDIVRKRKREDLELTMLEQEIIALKQANQIRAKEQYADVLSNKDNLDERARLMFMDNWLNLASVGTLAIMNAPEAKPISISLVATDMGYRVTSAQLIKVGKEVKKQYVLKYDKDPPKHEQLCDGRVTKVNSYTEADRDLIENVLRDHFEK